MTKTNHKTLSHRLSFTLAAALLAALMLVMFSGAASAQGSGVIGRGFTGEAMSVNPGAGLLTVESKGAVFQLTIDDSTVIDYPPDRDVGLEGLPTGAGFRIAGLVGIAVTDDKGNVTPEIIAARKITVIPEKATRSHRWTIAVDKEGDDLTTLDEDGAKIDLPGRGSGFEKGDRIIMLVQNAGQGGVGESVRGLFKAEIVGHRLDLLAQAEAGDSERAADIASLRSMRETAQEDRLQRTADNAGDDFRDFVWNEVLASQGSPEPGETSLPLGQTISECTPRTADNSVFGQCPDSAGALVDESPVILITSPSSGTVVSANDVVTVTAEARADADLATVTFTVAGSDRAALTEAPYTAEITIPTAVSSVEIKVTAVDAEGNAASDAITLDVARAADVGIKITSPVATVTTVDATTQNSRVSTVSGSSEAIAEGDTVLILAEASGMGAITVVFTVNGATQTPQTAPPYTLTHFLPLTPAGEDPPPLNITATATDGAGNTASDSVSIAVVRKTNPVNVTITAPQSGVKVNAGDTIVIAAETENDAEIAFVTFSVDGNETVTTAAPYTHTYVLPARASTTAAASNVPPNVFVGKATLGGVSAPNGTVVIAWIDGSDAATLSIKVTATANSGTTGSASVSLQVSGSINAGQATVKNGEFVLTAAQPSGQSFTGKTVTFTVDGKDARQTATWQKGGADVVDLTAN